VNVADIMTAAAVSDAADDSLAQASAKMWREKTGSLLVMEEDKIAGIVTERDVLRSVAEGLEPRSTSLSQVMTREVVTISPDTALKDAAEIMFQKWFRHLPVVAANGNVVGMISLRDLLTLVAESMDEPETLHALTGHKLVRDRRLELIEPGDLD
jgi:CBS domain-containing protein